jgi:putative addiction module component (TIGR02574 family)
MNSEQLETEVMKLSIEERAKPAERILLSLDAPSDEENLQLWVQEAQRRLKNLRDGNAKTVPAEDVFQKARTAILCNG